MSDKPRDAGYGSGTKLGSAPDEVNVHRLNAALAQEVSEPTLHSERPQVKVQLLPHFTVAPTNPRGQPLSLPTYATAGAAGVDLAAAIDDIWTIPPDETMLVPTGLVVEIPPGYEWQIRPRSGLAIRETMLIPNAPGTVDSDYRGEVKVGLFNAGRKPYTLKRGDRIAQAILAPVVQADFVQVTEPTLLSETARGAGGFGSTGT